MAALIVSGMIGLRPAVDRFVTLVGDPTSTPPQRGGALAVVMVFGLLGSIGILSLYLLEVPALNWMVKKSRQKYGGLREFIDSRHGRLEAVEMRPSVTYRYVAPNELRANEPSLFGGIVLLLFAIALAIGFPLSLRAGSQTDVGTTTMIFLVVGAMATGGALMTQKGVRFRRGLGLEFQLTRDGYVSARSIGGQSTLYRVARRSKRIRADRTTPGLVWWVLRGESVPPIVVDPRYLAAAT